MPLVVTDAAVMPYQFISKILLVRWGVRDSGVSAADWANPLLLQDFGGGQ
jgi:hypothetical protein